MNPIRPTGYPIQAPANPAADAARLAAQRAFFDQALGRAGAAAAAQAAGTPQAVAASAPQPAPAPTQPLRAAPAAQAPEGPAKPPRPGSYLDIRV